MFQNDDLLNHLQTSSSIKAQALVVAEWNLNIADNIFKVGNYRYRPTTSDQYRTLANSFDEYDQGNFYTGATDASASIDAGRTTEDIPIIFTKPRDKEKLLYSLDECFDRFRPRSGINKLRFFESHYLSNPNPDMAKRPRYYLADPEDKFKYWTSYRTENGERGISNITIGSNYHIEDAAPFVVYKDKVPANRVIVKMQTGVGSVDLGALSTDAGSSSDPFYGQANQTTPKRWKVQYLDGTNWIDAIKFDENSRKTNGDSVIGSDGYVEISYGLIVPNEYSSIFIEAEEFPDAELLPTESITGYAYLVRQNSQDIGQYYIWTGTEYKSFPARYGWYLNEADVTSRLGYVKSLTNPPQYTDNSSRINYREFMYVDGLRIVVDTMNKFDSTFDLIELSPRLAVDLSDRVTSYSVTKVASDLGVSGLPVSQLLASTGNLEIFDYDQSFNHNNEDSIISKYVGNNIQLKFYEEILDVDGYNYFVPIKTLYSEGFPEQKSSERKVTMSLRDMFFYFESLTAPQMLLRDISVSSAVSILLDSIGFSNYLFKRVSGESESIIPFFFIQQDQTIAQVLNDIAMSTQTAMFFDEYNNFVMMSREYMLPTTSERDTDMVLYGSPDSGNMSNIIDLSSQTNSVFNDGKIIYTERSIQRNYGTLDSAQSLDIDKNWTYKISELWNLPADPDTTPDHSGNAGTHEYALSAVPLNTTLTADVPVVVDGKIKNNIIDLGENISWVGNRYKGYFYANGEIIKYDAVQFSIPGIQQMDVPSELLEGSNVWISSVQEYQKYFSKVPFNGKIYRTGLVRIYSEPNYEVVDGVTKIKNGSVIKHGRGQFGTDIVSHDAGLNSHWTSDANVYGCIMDSEYLFDPSKKTTTVQGVSSSGKTLYVSDITSLKINQVVNLLGGTGQLHATETTRISAINTVINPITFKYSVTIDNTPVVALLNATISVTTDTLVEPGAAGLDASGLSKKATRNGIMKTFLSSTNIPDSDITQYSSAIPGSIQSSALIINGPSLTNSYNPTSLISYVNKPLDGFSNKFKHFGTRMRVIGRLENSNFKNQTPNGASAYLSAISSQSNTATDVDAASGGLGVLVNPKTNNGYFFELIGWSTTAGADDVIFYKVMKESGTSVAIPVKLWGQNHGIVVDAGIQTGQAKLVGDKDVSVYDLAVEYIDINANLRRFYLYINSSLVGVVDDTDPLPHVNNNNMVLFVRGGARCMFENVYALAENYAIKTSEAIDTPVNSVFLDDHITTDAALNKYAMSGLVRSVYLSGIGASSPPKYNIYYDEFGTIMREAAYFKVRYDKTYPALYAYIAPTYNSLKSYSTSGFIAGAYGAEFLIFNATDSAISLGSGSGNYLVISGIAFTNQSQNELSVDDFFSKRSDFSDPEYENGTRLISPKDQADKYLKIKNSRNMFGRNEFNITGTYIQNQDDAEAIMTWMTSKIMKPKRSVGMKLFAMPTLQLGDVVSIDYKDTNGVDIQPNDSRFVVYNIEYARTNSGPDMTAYLSEVI
jgi:hypothetical protein